MRGGGALAAVAAAADVGLVCEGKGWGAAGLCPCEGQEWGTAPIAHLLPCPAHKLQRAHALAEAKGSCQAADAQGSLWGGSGRQGSA